MVTVAAATHPGAVRQGNEDALVVGPWVCVGTRLDPTTMVLRGRGPVVCAVADGLGGHPGGEIASAHVANGLAAAGPGLHDEPSATRALQQLHAELFCRMESTPHLSGMGTTVAGLVILDGHVLAFNVGDSRSYRVQAGYLGQLSVDDSPGDGGGGRSSIVTQSLGGTRQPTDVTPHVAMFRSGWNERFLICTDGLTDALALADVERILAEGDGYRAVQRLVERALQLGAPDNVSVLVVDAAADEAAAGSTIPARGG